MADISQEELREEITAILKDADLSALSGKKVRQQIEEKLDIDLSSRRKEVDELVMECLQDKKDKSKKKNGSANNKSDDDDEEDEDEEEDEEEEEEKPKRAPKKPAPKRKQASSDESDDASDEDKDDDYSPKKKSKPAKKPAKKGRKKGSDSDGSDEDWGKKKKSAKKGGGGAKGGGGGYTKAIKLSPELSELMGEEAMPRHEVVKRIWALIKEKNLYDPKNKQFAICNDELLKVFGVKRFRTFGMMKLLKDHFIAS